MSQKSICIVFNNNFENGGASTYEQAFEKIFATEFIDQYKLTFLYTYKNKKSRKYSNINYIQYNLNLFRIFLIRLFTYNNIRFILNRFGLRQLNIEKKLKKLKIDLLIFASPNPLALGINSIPFCSTVWDLGHRDLPNYPEVSQNGNFEMREEFYIKTLPKSSIIFVDSDVTARKIIKIYGIYKERILILGLSWTLKYREMKSVRLDLVKEEDVFVIYPANFWYHKNHKFLIEIFNSDIIKRSKIKLVLTGVDKGSMKMVKNLVEQYQLSQIILFAGYVSVEQMNYLYNKSLGIVFPSELGPSNLPPLEGLIFNKKAIVSEKHTSIEFSHSKISIIPTSDIDLWQEKILDLLNYDSVNLAIENIDINETKNILNSTFQQFFKSTHI